MNDNKLFIEWKYDGKTIFKSNETDYHCGPDLMEIKRNKDEIWFKLRPKTTATPHILKIKPIANLDYMEIWTADGKYYQHDLNFSHLVKPSKDINHSEKKQTLKQWLEDGKISDEKYDFLNEWLNPDEVFSLAEINAKYWELKDKE